MLFESTDEDVVHRNVCRLVNRIPTFYLFTALKEKSSLSKSDCLYHFRYHYSTLCHLQLTQVILLTKTTAALSEVALSYHSVRGLYFLAVVFAVTIVCLYNIRVVHLSQILFEIEGRFRTCNNYTCYSRTSEPFTFTESQI